MRNRGKNEVMTVSRSSRNVLAILSKKQEIEFKTKKNVFYEEKDLCEKPLKKPKNCKKICTFKKKAVLLHAKRALWAHTLTIINR